MKLACLLLLLPLAPLMAGTARPAIVGSWDVVGTDANGVRSAWILEIKQDGEKLSGALHSKTDSNVVVPLEDVTFSGADLRFQLRINAAEVVELTAKLQGDRLEGRFAGKQSGSGTFEGKRRLDLSGEWTGRWDVSPDGAPGPHYMNLKQDGDTVTGVVGPSAEQTIAIRNGKFANGAFTCDVAIPNGLVLQFDFKPDGDALRGDVLMKMNGEERKLKLTATRLAR